MQLRALVFARASTSRAISRARDATLAFATFLPGFRAALSRSGAHDELPRPLSFAAEGRLPDRRRGQHILSLTGFDALESSRWVHLVLLHSAQAPLDHPQSSLALFSAPSSRLRPRVGIMRGHLLWRNAARLRGRVRVSQEGDEAGAATGGENYQDEGSGRGQLGPAVGAERPKVELAQVRSDLALHVCSVVGICFRVVALCGFSNAMWTKEEGADPCLNDEQMRAAAVAMKLGYTFVEDDRNW